jgi:hypothetical protein
VTSLLLDWQFSIKKTRIMGRKIRFEGSKEKNTKNKGNTQTTKQCKICKLVNLTTEMHLQGKLVNC